MNNTTYIDGVSQAHFIDGLVRMDTFILSPRQGGEPVPSEAGQLVMTPQGFLSMLGSMQQLADKLVEAGVLQKSHQ